MTAKEQVLQLCPGALLKVNKFCLSGITYIGYTVRLGAIHIGQSTISKQAAWQEALNNLKKKEK
jgi:hypothetical protein